MSAPNASASRSMTSGRRPSLTLGIDSMIGMRLCCSTGDCGQRPGFLFDVPRSGLIIIENFFCCTTSDDRPAADRPPKRESAGARARRASRSSSSRAWITTSAASTSWPSASGHAFFSSIAVTPGPRPTSTARAAQLQSGSAKGRAPADTRSGAFDRGDAGWWHGRCSPRLLNAARRAKRRWYCWSG